jgi:hypothetical protein
LPAGLFGRSRLQPVPSRGWAGIKLSNPVILSLGPRSNSAHAVEWQKVIRHIRKLCEIPENSFELMGAANLPRARILQPDGNKLSFVVRLRRYYYWGVRGLPAA